MLLQPFPLAAPPPKKSKKRKKKKKENNKHKIAGEKYICLAVAVQFVNTIIQLGRFYWSFVRDGIMEYVT